MSAGRERHHPIQLQLRRIFLRIGSQTVVIEQTVGRQHPEIIARLSLDEWPDLDFHGKSILGDGLGAGRLASPCGNIEPLTVFGNLEPVCPGRFAPGNDLPSRTGMPFPYLAVILTRQHFSASARIGITREKIRRGEATVRERDNGVQSDGLRCNRTSDPGQGRRFRASVKLEDFDRFSVTVVDDI